MLTDGIAAVQNDIHTPATTIREALYFSARCRLTDIDKNQLEEFVEEVCCLQRVSVFSLQRLLA